MQRPIFTEVLVVTTTVGNMDDALRIARLAVKKQFAACVQLESLAASVYRWEGKVCEEPEVRLTFKALSVEKENLLELVREHHPYELPQLTWTLMECSEDYGSWLVANSSIDF